jgi:hypothetical protein
VGRGRQLLAGVLGSFLVDTWLVDGMGSGVGCEGGGKGIRINLHAGRVMLRGRIPGLDDHPSVTYF